MNTNIKKKGRIAMAWLIIITMVFATMSSPFAMASVEPPLDLHDIIKVDSAQAQYIIPGENDFVFIKQATADKGTYVIWTRDAMTDTQKQDILDYVIDQSGNSDDDATLALTNFFSGFGTFTITLDQGNPYTYTFSENVDDDIVLDNPNGKISHIWYGQYDREDEDYDLSVTKAVTLNGDESTAAIDGTVYVSLFSDAEYTTMVPGTTPQMITIDNGVATTATFTVEETGTYYVAETDSLGDLITAGGMMFGYHLVSIENSHSDGVEVTVEDSDLVTITNNLEYHPEGNGAVEVDKVLTGPMDLEADMFDFTIVETDDEWAPMTGGYTETVSNDADGNIPFSEIKYDEAGVYYYVISEFIPADAVDAVKDGITYDEHQVKVTMTVTDIGDDILEATATYNETDTTFTNSYATSGSGTISVTKEMTGLDLTDDMFSFTIVETDMIGTPVTEGYTETVKNLANGTIPFGAIDYTESGTYYYTITEEVIDGANDGITYDDHIIYVTMEVSDDGLGTLTGEATYEGGQVFTNSYEGPGSITVTKEVTVLGEDPEANVNYTFYTALFEDIEGTMVMVSDVKELVVVDKASTSVTFDGLDLNKTYYVFETDVEGNIIATDADGKIITPIIDAWTNISYENAVVTLSSRNLEGESTIMNVFNTEGFPLFGSITVNKTVTVNGKAFASNRIFYVALFADEELTEMVSDVKPLKMNGNSSTTTEFLTDMDGNPLEAGMTYYIAETDKDGVPLTGTFEELGFEIDIDNTQIVITEEGTTVNIINNFKSEEFPLTGDNSNMNLWLFLAMLGVAGAIAPFAFRKKEEAND